MYAQCVQIEASHYGPREAAARCDQLPRAAATTCRAWWVEQAVLAAESPSDHAAPLPSRDELLVMCGDDADCRFFVVDRSPEPDPVAQIRVCIAQTGPYVADCVGHTLQNWTVTSPDAASIAAVTAAASPWPDKLGWALGTVAWCSGKRADAPMAATDLEALGCTALPTVREECYRIIRSGTRAPPKCTGHRPPPVTRLR